VLNKSLHIPTYRAFFIFSSSSTGKSTAVREAISKLPKDCEVALLNVRADEVELYKRAHKRTLVLQSGTAIRDCIDDFRKGQYVVVEDIINLADKDEAGLRELINFKAHHDELRIICISHMLYKTKMLTLLPLFNFVLFTLAPSSRALLKIACVQGFRLDSKTVDLWQSKFVVNCKRGAKGSFAYIDSAQMKLHFSDVTTLQTSSSSTSSSSSHIEKVAENDDNAEGDDDDNDDDDCNVDGEHYQRLGKYKNSIRKRKFSSDLDSLERKFAECFAGHPKASTAKAIFSIISKVLTDPQCSAFRSFDMSFAFAQRRTSSKLKRVSIVDYIDSLLDSAPVARADPSHKALHRYLKKRCKLPKMFILNPSFVLPDDSFETSDESE